MTTAAATAEDPYFEVQLLASSLGAAIALWYDLCLADVLGDDTLSTATWTRRDTTQCTIVTSEINQNQLTVTFQDGSTRTFAVGEVARVKVSFEDDAVLKLGDELYLDCVYTTSGGETDVRTLKFLVVENYSR